MTADSTLTRQPPCNDMRETYTFLEAVTCSCREKEATSTRCLGPIKAEYTSKILHEPSCKILTKTREERKTTVKFSMRPFVNKTIELVLRSSFGAGGSSYSRQIKSHRTVSRLLSPAFQKFESLNCLRWESSYEIFTDLMKSRAPAFLVDVPSVTQCDFTHEQSILCHSSDDIILARLDGLPETLEEIFRSGKAHPADRDEFGNTFIHVSNPHIHMVLPRKEIQ